MITITVHRRRQDYEEENMERGHKKVASETLKMETVLAYGL